MLELLLGKEIRNVCVVVTRYFGGILLGTGGLARAYSAAVKEGLKNSIVLEKIPARKLAVHTDYNGAGKLNYLAVRLGFTVLDTEYTDRVMMLMLVPATETESAKKQITEKTNGQAVIEERELLYYGMMGRELLQFSLPLNQLTMH